jgi:hypothetical protein
MNLLPTLIGVTFIFVNVVMQAVSAEVLPEETSVCGVQIGDLYCRSGALYVLW